MISPKYGNRNAIIREDISLYSTHRAATSDYLLMLIRTAFQKTKSFYIFFCNFFKRNILQNALKK